MIRKSREMKQYMVLLVLTGFISVFVCDFLCDIGVISWNRGGLNAIKNDHHQAKPHVHHDALADHHHSDKHDHDDGSGEDECCDEMVKNIYSSLIRYEFKHITFENPVHHLSYQLHTVEYKSQEFSQKIISFLYTNLPPPISGFHIRVFIKSFLN